jgi:signal transduction histidine kinase
MTLSASPTARAGGVAAVIEAYDVLHAPPTHDLVALAQLATVVCGVSSAAVNIIDDTTQHTIATYGPMLDPGSCEREDSMCAIGFQSESLVVSEDASTDPRFARNPFVTGTLASIRLYASASLRTPDGWVIGTLCVYDDKPGTLSALQRGGLQTLAHQVIDLFELRRRTALLRAKIEELERSQAQLVSFAGQISHDLKTPLTSIIGFAEMASDRPSVASDEVALRYVQRTQASGRRMLGLIDDLLDYARVDGKLRREEVSLLAVFEQVKSDLRWAAVGAGVSATCEDASVYGDPSQIRLLMQNLLTNALKYGRPVHGEIAVTVQQVDGARQLRVADNGAGIPLEQRGIVLEPLARLRDDVPGTGLGLATCQRIARAHGGQLMLAETPGGGLTVVVELPDPA